MSGGPADRRGGQSSRTERQNLISLSLARIRRMGAPSAHSRRAALALVEWIPSVRKSAAHATIDALNNSLIIMTRTPTQFISGSYA